MKKLVINLKDLAQFFQRRNGGNQVRVLHNRNDTLEKLFGDILDDCVTRLTPNYQRKFFSFFFIFGWWRIFKTGTFEVRGITKLTQKNL